jgi:hypothetical protein
MPSCSLHDRDVSNSFWNHYLKKYSNDYRLTRDENNIWHIKCKYGEIQLYSIKKHLLAYVAEFRSKKQKTWFKKKVLSKNGTIAAEGELDIVYVFEEKFLDSLVSLCQIYRRKNLSDEYRRVLSDRMKKMNRERKQRSSEEPNLIENQARNGGG